MYTQTNFHMFKSTVCIAVFIAQTLAKKYWGSTMVHWLYHMGIYEVLESYSFFFSAKHPLEAKVRFSFLNFCHHLLMIMSFQTCTTFFFRTQKKIFSKLFMLLLSIYGHGQTWHVKMTSLALEVKHEVQSHQTRLWVEWNNIISIYTMICLNTNLILIFQRISIPPLYNWVSVVVFECIC